MLLYLPPKVLHGRSLGASSRILILSSSQPLGFSLLLSSSCNVLSDSRPLVSLSSSSSSSSNFRYSHRPLEFSFSRILIPCVVLLQSRNDHALQLALCICGVNMHSCQSTLLSWTTALYCQVSVFYTGVISISPSLIVKYLTRYCVLCL